MSASAHAKMGYSLMQNMHEREFVQPLFSSAGLHTVRGEWAKCWTALRKRKEKKRTEWALWRWHKSRGESGINVNAFSVTSTSFLRPRLLLPIESVNRFLRRPEPWTYLMPIIALKGFFCPRHTSWWSKACLGSVLLLRPCVDPQKSRVALL